MRVFTGSAIYQKSPIPIPFFDFCQPCLENILSSVSKHVLLMGEKQICKESWIQAIPVRKTAPIQILY